MYLTKGIIPIILCSQNRLLDNHQWHKFIWKCFKSDHRSFIHRTEDHDDSFYAYILSHDAPLIPDIGRWETKQIPDRFFNAESYMFRVKVNPVVSKYVEGKKHGKRVGIYNSEEIINWFNKKGELSGFSVKDATIMSIQKEICYKGSTRITHSSADIQGVMKITDTNKFKECVLGGIGNASSKAFGFGLMLLKQI